MTANVANKDIEVPDIVFLGLTEGMIKGPLIKLPKIYAKVSFKNEIIIIRYNNSLSWLIISYKLKRKIIIVIVNKYRW